MIRPKIWKKFEFKEGKGFSLRELKSVGISLSDAKRLDLAVDATRRSKYDDNITVLADVKAKAPKPVKKAAPKPAAKKAVKKTPVKKTEKKETAKKKPAAKKITKKAAPKKVAAKKKPAAKKAAPKKKSAAAKKEKA
ncbi:50S ribosomal protein L13e [archaeon BMS3Abin16]|nr:50S ribosomal protein L13e [archaeon BMS3Abin16]